MIVDVHNNGYILDVDIVESTQRKVIIDHHRRSPEIVEGVLLNYIEVYASSTSEMVTELIQYMVQKAKLKTYRSRGSFSRNFYGYKRIFC